MGERLFCKQDVTSSILVCSTNSETAMIALLATAYWLPAALTFIVFRRLTRPKSTRGRLFVAGIALCWPLLALIVVIGR